MGLPPRGRGDPFPLPLPGAVAGLQGYSSRRERRPSSLELRVVESVNSLNSLSGYARAESAHWAHRRREATSSQASAISRIRRRIEAYGPCPRDISPRSAFEEIIKTRDLYSLQTRNIVPFCEEKVSVLRGRVTPQPLLPLLPDVAREFALNHDLMAYNEQELDSLYQQELIPRIRPYWDPILKFSRTRRVSFIQKLVRVGLIGFRRGIKARVGMFFAAKKNGSQRLIIDGREASSLHRRPPHSSLGSSAAVASYDLSPQRLALEGLTPQDVDLHGAGTDMVDGFYQLLWREMGSWFGLNFPEAAHVYNAASVYDDALGIDVPVNRDEIIFPVFEALPMGWSWSLYYCHSLTSHVLARALESIPYAPPARLLLDGHRSPAPDLDAPLGSAYVDNANVVGLNRDSTQRGLDATLATFASMGILVHETVQPCRDHQQVGIVLHGRDLRVRHPARRTWRLWSASQHLLRYGGTTGAALRVYVGHLVHHFMLLRPALSALDECYHFINRHGERFGTFDFVMINELRVISGLILLAEVHMGAPWSPVAYCSDSSLRGYELSEAHLFPEELIQAGSYKERWRFLQVEAPLEIEGAPRPLRPYFPGSEAITRDIDDLISDETDAPAGDRALDSRRPRSHCITVANIPDLPASALSPDRWHRVVHGGWLYDAPIHILEARVQLNGIVRAASHVGCHGRRVLSLGDNLPAVLAFEKGRARDWALRRICSKLAARAIACELTMAFRHCPGHLNPTDRGSRAADRGEIAPGQSRRGDPRPLARMDALLEASPTVGLPGDLRPVLLACPPTVRDAFPGVPDHFPRLGIPGGTTFNLTRDADRHRSQVIGARARARPGRAWLRVDEETPVCLPCTATPSSTPSAATPPTSASSPAAAARARPAAPAPRSTARGSGRVERAFLEIFAGCARLSGAVRESGLLTGCPFELEHGDWFNITCPRILRLVLTWIKNRRVWLVHLAPPCTFWSQALAGRSQHHQQTGLSTAEVTLKIMRACDRANVLWTLENPKSSRLWNWPPLSEYLTAHGHYVAEVHYCQFKCSYQKATYFAGSFPEVMQLQRLCDGSHGHELLQGTVRVQLHGRWQTVWKTKLAGRYPALFCRLYARVVGSIAPPSAWNPPDGDNPVRDHWEASLVHTFFKYQRASHKTRPEPAHFRPTCPRHFKPEWPETAKQWAAAFSKPRRPAPHPEQAQQGGATCTPSRPRPRLPQAPAPHGPHTHPLHRGRLPPAEVVSRTPPQPGQRPDRLVARGVLRAPLPQRRDRVRSQDDALRRRLGAQDDHARHQRPPVRQGGAARLRQGRARAYPRTAALGGRPPDQPRHDPNRRPPGTSRRSRARHRLRRLRAPLRAPHDQTISGHHATCGRVPLPASGPSPGPNAEW